MSSQANQEVPFQLASLVQARAPEGSGGTWYRYVITQGANEITGLRNGEHAEVMHLVNEMVARLNERQAGKTRARFKPAKDAKQT